MMLSLLVMIAAAADVNDDGCEDSYFDDNTACVHPSVALQQGTTIGAGAHVRAYADVGPDTAVGASVVIGERTSIVGRVAESGARPIGAGTVIGRRVTIAADHTIGADNSLGRAVETGERIVTEGNVALGYGVVVGDDVFVGAGATLGSLVNIGDNTTIVGGTVIARGTWVADSQSAATIGGTIGPDVTIGGDATIAATARIRKGVHIGENANVQPGARIGRGSQIAASASIGTNVRLGAGVTVTANTTVPDGTHVRRGETYDAPLVDCLSPWHPVQNQGGVTDGVGTGTAWSVQNSFASWNGTVLSYNFTGDFEVVTSWASPYVGLGIMHGAAVNYADVTGYTFDSRGSTWGNARMTGFPNGYAGTFQGYSSVNRDSNTLTYYRWHRAGTTVSIQSSTVSAAGPWADIPGGPFAVPESDTVVIGIAEGWGSNTSSLLELLSCVAE